MIIETKFNKKDTVWTMKDNKAVNGIVDEIHVAVTNNGVYILYVLKGTMIKLGHKHEERELYANKQDLLNSL